MPQLMEDEAVLADCVTDNWTWLCTNRRLLKYRSEKRWIEYYHLSLDDISSTNYVDDGRNDLLGGYGVFSIIVGLIFIFFAFSSRSYRRIFGALGAILIAFGIGLLFMWNNSRSSHFQIRGSEVNTEQWLIDESSVNDPDRFREFVNTVNSQL